MQSSAKPSGEGKDSIVGDEDEHVVGSVENGGAMAALSEMSFQRGAHFRRNVVIQIVGDFAADILAI